ncbi:MAG: sugar phosphate isomerase/epimerase family protein [Christensenellaceae bacterium]
MKIGVDSFIWTELFSEKDLWIIPKAKELGFPVLEFAIADPFSFPVDAVNKELRKAKFDQIATSITLGGETNLISPDKAIRENGIRAMKKMIDINIELGSNIIAGVNYAAWGYLTKKPRTEQEWEWSVCAMREIATYAKNSSDIRICVEAVNRFETHFLNIAQDAVQYCIDVGTGNMQVHLDCFHMIREETSFTQAVNTCGKQYLGYVHVCENNRGIPGTGLVPFEEFFRALMNIGYDGPVVIESFDPRFEKLNGNCAIWRKFAETGEQLAVEGLKNLTTVLNSIRN